MNNQADDRVLMLILLPIALVVGIICCARPQFFVKRPGLRLGLLFRLIPEEYQPTIIRVLGGIAIFCFGDCPHPIALTSPIVFLLHSILE
jgi:hypothetical protein